MSKWRIVMSGIGGITVMATDSFMYKIIGLTFAVMPWMIPKKKKTFRRVN